jgi:hypothetical protein
MFVIFLFLGLRWMTTRLPSILDSELVYVFCFVHGKGDRDRRSGLKRRSFCYTIMFIVPTGFLREIEKAVGDYELL